MLSVSISRCSAGGSTCPRVRSSVTRGRWGQQQHNSSDHSTTALLVTSTAAGTGGHHQDNSVPMTICAAAVVVVADALLLLHHLPRTRCDQIIKWCGYVFVVGAMRKARKQNKYNFPNLQQQIRGPAPACVQCSVAVLQQNYKAISSWAYKEYKICCNL